MATRHTKPETFPRTPGDAAGRGAGGAWMGARERTLQRSPPVASLGTFLAKQESTAPQESHPQQSPHPHQMVQPAKSRRPFTRKPSPPLAKGRICVSARHTKPPKHSPAPAIDGAWGIQGERHRVREHAEIPLAGSFPPFLPEQERGSLTAKHTPTCSSPVIPIGKVQPARARRPFTRKPSPPLA